MLSTIGNIAAIACGDKCAIVWQYATREVWIAEVPVVGKKRALYAFAKGECNGRSAREIKALIARLERDAMTAIQSEAIAMNDAIDDAIDEKRAMWLGLSDIDTDLSLEEMAEELGIDLSGVGPQD